MGLLGSGSFGVVTKGKFNGTPVAIKSLSLLDSHRYILKEIYINNQLRHENIISLMAVSEEPGKILLVMQFFDSFTLRRVLFDQQIANKFPLNFVKDCKISHQICTAIRFMHELEPSIIHKDIKPENILVNENLHVKLCDFGLSSDDSIGDLGKN